MRMRAQIIFFGFRVCCDKPRYALQHYMGARDVVSNEVRKGGFSSYVFLELYVHWFEGLVEGCSEVAHVIIYVNFVKTSHMFCRFHSEGSSPDTGRV